MFIESPQNARIKVWRQLKTKKGRLEHGLYVIEGIRLVEEALHSDVELAAVLWDVGCDELPDYITEQPRVAKVFHELSPAAFAEVSDTTTPQGLIAIAKLPVDVSLKDLSAQAVLLDGVQDPGNVGTLLRSADAFGFRQICCGTGTVDPFAPKVVRASMGGMFRSAVTAMDSVAWIEAWLRCHPDGQVVVTAADAPKVCHEVDLTGACLLVIGSEAFGVSEAVRNLATLHVQIPMVAGAESLNAAIAGSVLLYESLRQRTQS
jgi:RNA methyltransferase, TrmH family